MQRIATGAVMTFLAALALGTTGCTTIAKQAFHEVRGAQGELYFNERVPPKSLAHYQSVEFLPAHTELGARLCKPATLGYCDRYAREVQADLSDVYTGGAPGLVVDTEVLYVKRKDLLGAAQLLARVRMRDGERVVVDAIMNAQSKSFREGGEKDLAEAGMQAVEEFLREHKEVAEDEADEDVERND